MINTIAERLIMHPYFQSPIFSAQRSAVKGNKPRRTHVAVLLGRRTPIAVGWFVVSVVISALDRILRRWFPPHVLNEAVERFCPSLANRNTSSAIPFVSSGIRILASLDHASPRGVLRRFAHIMSDAMRPTAACGRIAIGKAVRPNIYRSPAITQTPSFTITTLAIRSERHELGMDCQTAETPTDMRGSVILFTLHAVHSFVVNGLTRALGLFGQSECSLMIA